MVRNGRIVAVNHSKPFGSFDLFDRLRNSGGLWESGGLRDWVRLTALHGSFVAAGDDPAVPGYTLARPFRRLLKMSKNRKPFSSRWGAVSHLQFLPSFPFPTTAAQQ